MKYQLKSRQICLFIIAFFPIMKIFTAPSVLVSFANEDAWIGALLLVLLDFVCLIALLYAFKNAKGNVFSLMENSLGKVGSKFIFILFFIYFMLKAIVPLNEHKDYVDLTLYTLMPSKLYFLPFFAVAFYLCYKSLRVWGRSADVLWLFTIVGLLVLFLLSIPNADFSAILPIGANNFKNIVKGSYSALNWFGDVAYLVFFIGEFKFNKKDGKKFIISFIISAFLIIAFQIVFYSVFTSIAYRQRFALTETSKYSAVINNIGRFDYLGIVLILFSGVFSVSLPLYFACRSLNYVCSFNKKWIAPIIVVSIQFLIIVIFTQHYASIENFMKNYAGILFLIVGNILPLLICLCCKKENRYATNV